jgi:steroid delta-isomerase-like uncharacterized protein
VSEEENRRLFERYFDEVANGGNLDLVEEIFAPDYLHHDPANPDPRGVIGPQGVKDHLNSLRGGFPDLNFEIDDTIADGDEIIVRWTAHLTHTGDYFGIPPTGASVTITGMNTWRVQNGKAVEGWVNRDDMGLLQQLGVIPMPSEAPS